MLKTFFFKNRLRYEITWKRIVVPDRPYIIKWCIRIACCVLKTTNEHSEHEERIFFYCNSGYTKVTVCYVTRKMSLLFHFAPVGYNRPTCSKMYSKWT
jgi:hypothetical protein